MRHNVAVDAGRFVLIDGQVRHPSNHGCTEAEPTNEDEPMHHLKGLGTKHTYLTLYLLSQLCTSHESRTNAATSAMK